MLEASLPGLWSLRSQSMLLTDTHNFAEGTMGLWSLLQLAVAIYPVASITRVSI